MHPIVCLAMVEGTPEPRAWCRSRGSRVGRQTCGRSRAPPQVFGQAQAPRGFGAPTSWVLRQARTIPSLEALGTVESLQANTLKNQGQGRTGRGGRRVAEKWDRRARVGLPGGGNRRTRAGSLRQLVANLPH